MNRGMFGGIATLIVGGAYLVALINAIFDNSPGPPHSSWVLVAVFGTVAFVSNAILAALFRPDTLWAFPALFSVPLVLLSLLYLWDWAGLLMFGGITGATFLVGVAACVIVRAVLAVRGLAP